VVYLVHHLRSFTAITSVLISALPFAGYFDCARLQDGKQGFETFGVTKTRAGLRPVNCSIVWLLEVISQGVKRPEPETDQSLPLVPRLKNDWSYTATTTYDYMT
jgi:hypothetical protein